MTSAQVLFATVSAIALGLAVGSVAATTTSTPSFAQEVQLAQQAPWGQRMPCHDATEIAKQLNAKYQEAPVAFGLQTNGNLLQVYASKEKGTWTVVSTTPAGMSCIVAAGKGWESLPYDVKQDPAA
jgi:hypothetical protein